MLIRFARYGDDMDVDALFGDAGNAETIREVEGNDDEDWRGKYHREHVKVREREPVAEHTT